MKGRQGKRRTDKERNNKARRGKERQGKAGNTKQGRALFTVLTRASHKSAPGPAASLLLLASEQGPFQGLQTVLQKQ